MARHIGDISSPCLYINVLHKSFSSYPPTSPISTTAIFIKKTIRRPKALIGRLIINDYDINALGVMNNAGLGVSMNEGEDVFVSSRRYPLLNL